MAKSYHRPLLTFYLAAPPRQSERGMDFRRPPGTSSTLQPRVDALVRDVRSRQSLVRATLIAEDAARPPEFIGALQKRNHPTVAHKLLQDLLPEKLRLHYYTQQDAKSGSIAIMPARKVIWYAVPYTAWYIREYTIHHFLIFRFLGFSFCS